MQNLVAITLLNLRWEQNISIEFEFWWINRSSNGHQIGFNKACSRWTNPPDAETVSRIARFPFLQIDGTHIEWLWERISSQWVALTATRIVVPVYFYWCPTKASFDTIYNMWGYRPVFNSDSAMASFYPPEKLILLLYSLIAKFMGPTWDPSGADRTQVGPMLAPWTLLSGICIDHV